MAEEKTVLTYKGHPLMRKDNLIYYGSMADDYIVMLQILDSKKQGPRGQEERKRRPVHRPGCGLCLAGTRSGRQAINKRHNLFPKQNGGSI